MTPPERPEVACNHAAAEMYLGRGARCSKCGKWALWAAAAEPLRGALATYVTGLEWVATTARAVKDEMSEVNVGNPAMLALFEAVAALEATAPSTPHEWLVQQPRAAAPQGDD